MTNLYKCKECGRLVPIRSKGLYTPVVLFCDKLVN